MVYVFDCRAATAKFPGIGRYVSNLATAMADLLSPQERLTLLIAPESHERWPLPLDHAQVTAIETSLSHFSPRQHWAIPRLLRKIQADLYHAPYYMMPWRNRQPVVLTCYDFIPQRYPDAVGMQARRWFAMMHRIAWQRANHVIAISEATRKDAVALYDDRRKPVTVIPLAADPRFRPADPAAEEEVRRRFNLPRRYVLYLGINKPHKNLVRLVEAWAQVKSDARLIIAGAWDERYPEARDLVNQTGLSDRIYFLGRVSDDLLPALYSAAELFVFPSLYEGFGLPVIEAMACGTPVVCSYASSLPEVGGAAAVYFNPLVVEDIAQTLQAILNRPDEQSLLREKGLVHAGKFTWKMVGEKTVNVYRGLVLNN
ncbi:MAG: glycosyltransferase family 1 protein [Ardenticatenaceae bacterium]|nr:glycosyltransferase family 1 protein [Ardenticatenaceae bacterium]